jgi:hypothetical protein
MPSPASAPDTAATADPLEFLRQRLDSALALLDVTVPSPLGASQAARRKVNQLAHCLGVARGALVRGRDLLGRR